MTPWVTTGADTQGVLTKDEKVWAGWTTAACSKRLPLTVDQSHQYHQGACQKLRPTGRTQTQTAELAFTKITSEHKGSL